MQQLGKARHLLSIIFLLSGGCAPGNPWEDHQDEGEDSGEQTIDEAQEGDASNQSRSEHQTGVGSLAVSGSSADASVTTLTTDARTETLHESDAPALALTRPCSKAQPCTKLPPALEDCTEAHPCSVRLPTDYQGAALLSARSQVPADIRPLYFDHALTTPQRTPDGGTFEFYEGAWGQGAIYAHTSSDGAASAYPVYGDILATWARYRWETVLGYPTTAEHDASNRSPSHDCLARGGVRQQVFGYVTLPRNGLGGGEVVLCWSPSQGTFVLPQTVADALNRAEPVQRWVP